MVKMVQLNNNIVKKEMSFQRFWTWDKGEVTSENESVRITTSKLKFCKQNFKTLIHSKWEYWLRQGKNPEVRQLTHKPKTLLAIFFL